MPFTSTLIILGIVVAFAAFGVTLAWGEYQTRNLVRDAEPDNAKADDRRNFKKAA